MMKIKLKRTLGGMGSSVKAARGNGSHIKRTNKVIMNTTIKAIRMSGIIRQKINGEDGDMQTREVRRDGTGRTMEDQRRVAWRGDIGQDGALAANQMLQTQKHGCRVAQKRLMESIDGNME